MKDFSGTIDSIRERVDIVELVREYVPALKKAGRTWKACCPFHSEKTPSFTVNQEKGLFYCFGCQTGGDIFGFVMQAENLTFNEAAEKLAQRAGVEWRPRGGMLAKEETERLELRRALDYAREIYHKALLHGPSGKTALQYLEKRGLSAETIEKFELGWAPSDYDSFLRAARKSGYKDALLHRAGLIGTGEGRSWDYFRGRVLFPIRNHRGEMAGFGGRILGDGEPKYLNSPETPLFSKSRVLFGISQASSAIRKANRAIVMEGYMDVIASHQYGVETAVAPLGTALGAEHAKLLKRYCESVVLLFDPDAAGIRAAIKGSQVLIEAGLFVKIASLPDGLDPDEYLQQFGREKFDAAVDAAVDALEFYADTLLAGKKKPLSAQDKAAISDELIELIAKHPDSIARAEWLRAAAARLSASEAALSEKLSRKRAEAVTPRHYHYKADAAPVAVAHEPEIPVEERDLVRFSLALPSAAGVAQELGQQEFVSTRAFSLLQGILKLCGEGVPSQNVAVALSEAMPEEAGFIARLAAEPLPDDFDAARDAASCAARVRRAHLKRRYAQLKEQTKDFIRRGQDTSALKEEQNRIAVILKSSRNQ
jgi:DNA primase